MQLPDKFEKRMREMLGEEYAAFAASLDEAPLYRGIRISRIKKGASEAVLPLIGNAERVKWCENGYYTDKSELTGRHPYHVGGLVYFQEPSAMSAAAALPVKPSDRVLDLCAAPGGKATQAAERLGEDGLLVANEIVPKRAKILAENIGRMGIKNAVVTNEAPERLAEKYIEFFDKIIVDAPCSGEGMFRKEPQAAEAWSEEHVKSCAQRQKNILASAVKMLAGGGYLVYSTCTFAPEENEGVTDWLLESCPELELVPIEAEGMSAACGSWALSSRDLTAAKRIFPHRAKGEGHYTALFHKTGGGRSEYSKTYKCDKAEAFYEFARGNLNCEIKGAVVSFGDRLYLLPHSLDIDKIKVERAGLYLGDCRKNRFEPSHELCLALEGADFKRTLETAEPEKFFRGETLPCDEKGWTAVLYNGFPIGWGKSSGGTLKNHFPKYLRF